MGRAAIRSSTSRQDPVIAFLLDEVLSPAVAEIATGLGLDVSSVHAMSRTGLPDADQLAFAAAEGRVLVTRNRDDFITLTRACYATNQPHAGIVIVPRSLPNTRAEAIAHALVRWSERYAGERPEGGFIDFL